MYKLKRFETGNETQSYNHTRVSSIHFAPKCRKSSFESICFLRINLHSIEKRSVQGKQKTKPVIVGKPQGKKRPMTIRAGVYDNKFKVIFPENRINGHSAYDTDRFFYYYFFLFSYSA